MGLPAVLGREAEEDDLALADPDPHGRGLPLNPLDAVEATPLWEGSRRRNR